MNKVRITAASTFFVGEDSDPQVELDCGEAVAIAQWDEGASAQSASIVCSSCPE